VGGKAQLDSKAMDFGDNPPWLEPQSSVDDGLSDDPPWLAAPTSVLRDYGKVSPTAKPRPRSKGSAAEEGLFAPAGEAPYEGVPSVGTPPAPSASSNFRQEPEGEDEEASVSDTPTGTTRSGVMGTVPQSFAEKVSKEGDDVELFEDPQAIEEVAEASRARPKANKSLKRQEDRGVWSGGSSGLVGDNPLKRKGWPPEEAFPPPPSLQGREESRFGARLHPKIEVSSRSVTGFRRRALPPPTERHKGRNPPPWRTEAARDPSPDDDDPPWVKVGISEGEETNSEGRLSPARQGEEDEEVANFIRESREMYEESLRKQSWSPEPRSRSPDGWSGGKSSSSSGWKKSARPPELVDPPDLLAEFTTEVEVALGSKAGTFFETPPWLTLTKPKSAAASGVTPWALPPKGSWKAEAVVPEDDESKVDLVPESDVQADLNFKKTAAPPPLSDQDGDEAGVAPAALKMPGPPLKSLSDKQVADRKAFGEKTMEIYLFLDGQKLDLDITSLISVPGPSNKPVVDMEKLMAYTVPRKARTGIRYANMMLRFIDFCKNERLFACANVTCLKFLEFLKRENVGARTLEAARFAYKWYAKALGYDGAGMDWHRCKTLASDYTKEKAPEPDQADSYNTDFVRWLEGIILDESRHKADRAVAARCRICFGASIRHDDLLRTPLGRCEWIGQKGTNLMQGMRSRAADTKTGSRTFVVSYLGVCPEHDKWLSTAMELVLESHGATWQQDDHFGKSCTKDRLSFTSAPATHQQDTWHIRILMIEALRDRGTSRFSEKEVRRFRWHGAKCSLTSLMQHLNIDSRAIRHAGFWSSKVDTMPDVYLRHSQLLALNAQEQCLRHLRSGNEVVAIIGTPISEGQKVFFAEHDPTLPTELQGGILSPSPAPSELGPVVLECSSYVVDNDVLPNFEADETNAARIRDAMAAYMDVPDQGQVPLETLESDRGPNDKYTESSDSDTTKESEPDALYGESAFLLFVLEVAGEAKARRLHVMATGDRDIPTARCGATTRRFQVVPCWDDLGENLQCCSRAGCFGIIPAEDRNGACAYPCNYLKQNDDQVLWRCSFRCSYKGCEKVDAGHRCSTHSSP